MDVVVVTVLGRKVIEKERLEFGFGVFEMRECRWVGLAAAWLCVFLRARACAFVFVEADRHKHIGAHCPSPSLSLVYRLRRTTQDLVPLASEYVATLLLLILSRSVKPQRLFECQA